MPGPGLKQRQTRGSSGAKSEADPRRPCWRDSRRSADQSSCDISVAGSGARRSAVQQYSGLVHSAPRSSNARRSSADETGPFATSSAQHRRSPRRIFALAPGFAQTQSTRIIGHSDLLRPKYTPGPGLSQPKVPMAIMKRQRGCKPAGLERRSQMSIARGPVLVRDGRECRACNHAAFVSPCCSAG